jgi:hypothetical protein
MAPECSVNSGERQVAKNTALDVPKSAMYQETHHYNPTTQTVTALAHCSTHLPTSSGLTA